ncbi:Lipoprotein signal peptidase, partial [Frankliniella fusca]
ANFALQLKGWRENIENFCGSKPPEGGCGSRQAQGFYPLWQPTASVFHGNRRFADCDPIAQFDRFDPRTTIGLPLEVRAVSRALDFLIPVSEALPQRGTRDSNPQPRVPTRSQNRKRPNAQSHRANGGETFAKNKMLTPFDIRSCQRPEGYCWRLLEGFWTLPKGNWRLKRHSSAMLVGEGGYNLTSVSMEGYTSLKQKNSRIRPTKFTSSAARWVHFPVGRLESATSVRQAPRQAEPSDHGAQDTAQPSTSLSLAALRDPEPRDQQQHGLDGQGPEQEQSRPSTRLG